MWTLNHAHYFCSCVSRLRQFAALNQTLQYMQCILFYVYGMWTLNDADCTFLQMYVDQTLQYMYADCPSLHNNACNSQLCKLYFCSLCISMQTFNLFPHVQCTSYIAMVYALYVRRSFVQTFLFTFITFKKNTYIISHNLCSASFQQQLFHDIFPNSFPTPGAAFFKAFLVFFDGGVVPF